MRSFLGVPILVAGEPFGNLYLTEKTGGGEFTADDEESIVLLAEFAGVAIDHAQKYTGLDARRGELEQTVAALDASIQIARALGAETDIESVLELVAKRGRALVDARALVIESIEGDELVITAGAGELPQGIVGKRVERADTVASAALRTRRSQRLDDELNRSRFDRHGLGLLGFDASFALVVPLVYRDQGYGVLVVVDRLDGTRDFTPAEQRLLESFASSAAVAIATAQSVNSERSRQLIAGAEEERGRWARELHDETLQGLASLKLLLAAARNATERTDADQAIGQALEQLQAEITTLRALITELRPAALDSYGAEAAIRALAERARAAGLDVDVDIDLAFERGRLPTRHSAEVETALYRIIQEALTNARKNGHAQRAVVEVVEDEQRIRITVRDDGVGFDADSETKGFGLLGIRERAKLLDGSLEITTSPGNGTTITVEIPARKRRVDPSGGPQLQPTANS